MSRFKSGVHGLESSDPSRHVTLVDRAHGRTALGVPLWPPVIAAGPGRAAVRKQTNGLVITAEKQEYADAPQP